MISVKRWLLALTLLPLTLAARASDQTLLIELEPRSAALPDGVSAGGSVVVGAFGEGGGFYWMPTTGVISTGGLGATNVSRDGRTIVGVAAGSRGLQAAVWLRAAEWRLLGSFSPDDVPCGLSLSGANGTSDDGRVVVGHAWIGCELTHAFRWEESTGMIDLGSSVPGQSSLALGVSGDGKVVVGYQQRQDGATQGAQWVDGRQELLAGPDGYVGTANAANKDGSIVVGRICSPNATQPSDPRTRQEGTKCLAAPRLRVATGGPVIIVEANGTSDDGRVTGGGQNVGGSEDSDAIL